MTQENHKPRYRLNGDDERIIEQRMGEDWEPMARHENAAVAMWRVEALNARDQRDAALRQLAQLDAQDKARQQLAASAQPALTPEVAQTIREVLERAKYDIWENEDPWDAALLDQPYCLALAWLDKAQGESDE